MPSANSNKLSLPIWTGTATQYATITPVVGTALGAWALFGNRRSSVLGGAGGGMLGDGSTNINVLGATAGSGSGAPTAFQAWEKSCEDTLALQGGLYQWALTQQNQRFEDRERLNSELFGSLFYLSKF